MEITTSGRHLASEGKIRSSWQLGAMLGEWFLNASERVEDYVLNSEGRFKTTLQFLSEQVALQQGAWRAKLAAQRAWRQVPAYRHFLAAHGIESVRNFEQLPVMNKGNYIKAYSIEERCVGGKFLSAGVMQPVSCSCCRFGLLVG